MFGKKEIQRLKHEIEILEIKHETNEARIRLLRNEIFDWKVQKETQDKHLENYVKDLQNYLQIEYVSTPAKCELQKIKKKL